MTDMENVIKGLECCVMGGGCGACPYYSKKDCPGLSPISETLMKDALRLLKAQEPRAITLAELEYTEIAYAEDKDKTDIIPVLVKGRRYDRFAMVKGHLGDGTSHVFHPSIYDYGKRWRCWTARPTDEQREAVPWE